MTNPTTDPTTATKARGDGIPQAASLLVALGGTSWRNRPLAFLYEAAADGLVLGNVVARDPADIRGFVAAAWPAAEVHPVSDQLTAGDSVALGLWAAATGLASVPVSGADSSQVVTPIRPDLAVLHVPYASADGDAYWAASDDGAWYERLIVAASSRVIVVADEILTPAQSRRRSAARVIRAADVEEVMHTPYGAFPGSCDGLYRGDDHARDAFTSMLTKAAAGQLGPGNADRLATLTTPQRLAELSHPHGLGWHTT
jgi:hypothetical protein